MHKQNISWINELEQLIQKKHMLSHPFYQAWTCGTLTKATLQDYAKEYYHHVKAFPTYLSALHSRCNNPEIRKSLLTNLIDEEAGDPNHPDLWRSFTIALGVDQKDLDTHNPRISTQELINHFRESCCGPSLASGVAALYSYESQIPAICQTKIDGLKKWYGLTEPKDYRYFSVHESADVEHSREELQILTTLVTTPEEKTTVLKSVEKILDSLWNFLSSFQMDSTHCTSMSERVLCET